MGLRVQCICVDTVDPVRLAAFWESALGWRRTHEGDDEVVLEPSANSREDGVVPDLLFLRVPEGAGSISPRVAGHHRLTDIHEAQNHFLQGGHVGKIVITP